MIHRQQHRAGTDRTVEGCCVAMLTSHQRQHARLTIVVVFFLLAAGLLHAGGGGKLPEI